MTKIHVLAVGAHAGGGQFPGADGGFGGTATADLPVSPGQVLYVAVGGGGGGGCPNCGNGGGFNGGGAGGNANGTPGGGGGGASDVRTMSFSSSPLSLASRLIVAGGGGGGGGNGPGGFGGVGGAAGAPGASTTQAGGGGGATTTSGGTGGVGSPIEASGGSGGAGGGGGGGDGIGNRGGGGGGGGLNGGGGGAGGDQVGGGGGGGGSSGFGVTAINRSVGLDTTAIPLVRITTIPGGNDSGSKTGLKFGKVKRNKKKGTALLPVTVPGSGTLSVGGKNVVKKRPCVTGLTLRLAKQAPLAGTYRLKIKSKGAKRAKLFDTGKVKVNAVVTFQPTSGDVVQATEKIKLKKN